MNWIATLRRLHIDTYITHAGVTVVRISDKRFLVLRDGYVTDIGGRRHTLELALAEVVEEITGVPQPVPCAKCERPREVSSYCREHYNQMHLEPNRRRNAKRKEVA